MNNDLPEMIKPSILETDHHCNCNIKLIMHHSTIIQHGFKHTFLTTFEIGIG